MIEDLFKELHTSGLDIEPLELADALWLATKMVRPDRIPEPGSLHEMSTNASAADLKDTPGSATNIAASLANAENPPAERGPLHAPTDPSGEDSHGHIYLLPNTEQMFSPGDESGLLIRVPVPPALPDTLTLGRALRAFQRRVPSRTEVTFDEEATAERIAEQGIWQAVSQPATTRWLDVALVVDDSPSTAIWRELIDEFRLLLERQGAFRDVRQWSFNGDDQEPRLGLRPRSQQGQASGVRRNPWELIHPRGERLVIVVSDCVGSSWHRGTAWKMILDWGAAQPIALLQLLPQRLWSGTALASVVANIRSPGPAAANRKFTIDSQFPLADTLTPDPALGEEH
ncbi:SAV_2336 N-terminal domain-related protein, partial [Frankia sp. CiP3]|uniref:SAV_2336 N-terminal domain-related protein n=1 Tax=Frankia sp. CiP3 TaxID=2880971 RepID=UPI00272DDDE3